MSTDYHLIAIDLSVDLDFYVSLYIYITMTKWFKLEDRALLHLSGADVHKLLQGVVTNNLDLLSDDSPALFSALLSPQGKFLYDFFMVRDGDDIILDVPSVRMPDFHKKLKMYRLRADMKMTELKDWQVYASPDGECPELGIAFLDPRYDRLGSRWLVKRDVQTHIGGDAADYDLWRLQHGIPDGVKDAILDRSLALELQYDLLHAIDFHKGCYVGQEVTARSKYRGNIRKKMLSVSAQETLPPKDTVIKTIEGKEIGVMRSSRGRVGIALIRVELWQQACANGQDIVADDAKIVIQNPIWMVNNDNS